MMELWPILLGWPAILVSLVLSVVGIVRRSPAWLIISAIVVVPLAFYLFGTPRFWWAGLLCPVLLVGASIAIRRSRPGLAWSLFVPFVGFFGWLAVIVMSD